MSRPSQLPPRCPLKRNVGVHQTLEPNSINPRVGNKSSIRHNSSLSQSSMFEDQPVWIDDLLSDSVAVPKGTHPCRSASDSLTFFDHVVPNLFDEEHVEAGKVLESGCIYGPNSPRRRSNVEFSDSTVLLALSDYVSKSPIQFVQEKPWNCGASRFDLKEDYCDVPNDLVHESKTGKRHPGQRSRARKLQYIAELERTVNVFQTLESELAVRVSTLLQQKVALSLENNKLKQQMTMLQQQKLMTDGEYQNLQKEAERLKLGLANCTSSKIGTYLCSNDNDSAEISWQTLDWTKLHM